MNTVLHWLHQLAELVLFPFDLMPDWLGLLVFSILSGAGMLWVFGKTTPQTHLERARDKLLACVYEIRLYIDSPRRVIVAQSKLIYYTLLYTVLMLPAFVVLTIPLGLIFVHLELRWSLDPLPTNESVVIKVALEDGVDGRKVEGVESDGISITAPPLYVEEEDLVYLRAELAEAERYTLTIDVDGTEVTKQLDASADTLMRSAEAGSGPDLLYLYTGEPPIDADAGVDWISVDHEWADQTWYGVAWPWWVPWLIIATVTAFALRNRMRVVL